MFFYVIIQIKVAPIVSIFLPMLVFYEMAIRFLMNGFYDYIPVVHAVQSEE